MKELVLAYNKLTTATLPEVFSDILSLYKKDRTSTLEAFVTLVANSNVEENIIPIASLIKIVHAVLETKITAKIVKSTNSIQLYCYLYNYGIIDSTMIIEQLNTMIDQKDTLSILRVLQMCSRLLDTDALECIYKGVSSLECSQLKEFIILSVEMIRKGNNPYRESLKEEIEAMNSTLTQIIAKHTNRPIEVLSTTTDGTDDIDRIANRYGMNTLLKKRVFKILTSSEGYIDAQRQLYKEGLKVKQFEELFSLLVYLCTKESFYNPYYFQLAHSLLSTCSSGHKSIFTKYIYLSVENQLRHLKRLKATEIYNLSQYITSLYTEGIISFRPITSLECVSKKEQALIRLIFKTMYTHYQTNPLKKLIKTHSTDHFLLFYNTYLIDNLILTQEHKSVITQLYPHMFKQSNITSET
ncbi:hypothetical protein NEOKW01_1437 [Nematocida sp. AWRm80]|nr:hypothetical protein NEOKW01_1437 [Nematocida sp. AWRm80]